MVIESRKEIFRLRDETKEYISTLYSELKGVNKEIKELKRNIKVIKDS